MPSARESLRAFRGSSLVGRSFGYPRAALAALVGSTALSFSIAMPLSAQPASRAVPTVLFVCEHGTAKSPIAKS
jgi:hypothetical protein